VPHFILADEDDKYMPFEFKNNTYFKNVTFDDGESPKEARFEELYHYADQTKGRLPQFTYRSQYVPFGDSKSSCLNLKYRSKDLPLTNYDKFTPFQNQPNCFGYKEEIWSKEDPRSGINLLIWKEFGNEHKGNCRDGIFKNNI
jgi:hypothetical protein